MLGKAAAEAAVAMADGKRSRDLPGVSKFNKGKKGVEMNTILLTPTPITKDTLNLVDRRRLDHQGQGLRRREEGQGQGLRLIGLTPGRALTPGLLLTGGNGRRRAR